MGLLSRIRGWFRSRSNKNQKQEITPYKKEIKVTETAIVTKEKEIKSISPITTKKSIARPSMKKSDTKKIVSEKPKITETMEPKPILEKPISSIADIKPEAKSEAQILKKEFDDLSKEKLQIKKDMEELDKKLVAGELTDMERDRMFREKMVRAAVIAYRLIELKSISATLGRPIE